MKNKNQIYFILGVITLLILVANNVDNKDIDLKVHYYKNGVEVTPQKGLFSVVTPDGGSYDQISFSLSATNTGSPITLQIIDASPIQFKNALPTTNVTLAKGESKTIFTSNLIDTAQFESLSQPVRFLYNISAYNSNLGTIYKSGYVDLAIESESGIVLIETIGNIEFPDDFEGLGYRYLAKKITINENIIAKNISAYLSDYFTSDSRYTRRFQVYDSNGNLVGQTPIKTVTGRTGIFTDTFASPLLLSPGDYYLTVNAFNTNAVGLGYTDGIGYSSISGDHTAPTSLLPLTQNNNDYTIYLGTINLCYQESANVPNQVGTDTQNCGLQYTGNYNFVINGWEGYQNAIDGNFETSTGYSSGSSYLYINYTKPSGAISSLWRIRDGDTGNALDLKIPIQCWNAYSNKLVLKINDFTVGGYLDFPSEWTCYNGASWSSLRYRDWSGNIYEEAMIWEIDSSPEPACFLANTKVTMANGSKKNIEDIKIGEYVKSYDEKTKEIVSSKVIELFHHKPQDMEDYYLIINNKTRVTPNHPIMLNGKFQEIRNAKIGDYLLDENNNKILITKLEKVYEKVPTYNLEIENTHTYYAEDILVHNVKPF